jgi:hypothetical protein
MQLQMQGKIKELEAEMKMGQVFTFFYANYIYRSKTGYMFRWMPGHSREANFVACFYQDNADYRLDKAQLRQLRP